MAYVAIPPWRAGIAWGSALLIAASCGSSDDESVDVIATSGSGSGGSPTGSGVSASSWSTTGTTTGSWSDDPCETYGGYHCDDYWDCYAPGYAMIAPGDVAVMGLDLCSPTQVVELEASCLGPNASASACDAFEAANEVCFGCLVSFDSNGNQEGLIPPLLFGAQEVYANLWACQALVGGQPGCAKRLADFGFCMITSCETCDEASFETCLDTASSPGGVCADNLELPPECATFMQEAPPPECVNDALEPTLADLVIGVGTVFCGPPL